MRNLTGVPIISGNPTRGGVDIRVPGFRNPTIWGVLYSGSPVFANPHVGERATLQLRILVGAPRCSGAGPASNFPLEGGGGGWLGGSWVGRSRVISALSRVTSTIAMLVTLLERYL